MRGNGMRRVIALAAVFAVGAAVRAQAPEFKPVVTDVTVFKDGHALIMARAKAKLDGGWCRTREVPAPVLGTFWAFAADDKNAVDFVRAGTVELKEERACLTMEEIIQANAGKSVSLVAQVPGDKPVTYAGTLLGILENESKDEGPTMLPPGERYDRYGRTLEGTMENVERKSKTLASFVMLKEDKSVRMIKRENVVSLTVDDPRTVSPQTRVQREISLHVVGAQGKPAGAEGEVGIVYLQKGIRWIPEYRVDLLEGGQARVTLQGTIINEIADLDNVNMRLVVGVPNFIMKDTLSPLALREAAPRLSSYFAPPPVAGRPGQFSNGDFLSNAIMSQQAMPGYAAPPAGAGPNVPMEGQKEDLYLYHQAGVTLKKGERAVIKLLEVTVPYEDVYKYEVPPLPPRGMWQNANQDQVRQLAAALSAAKVMHVLRLTNNGDAPWTTGPATIFKSGDPLAQQILTYTSVKNSADLPVTVATDLSPKREETEVKREPNSLSMDNSNYTKVSMHGKLTIASFKDKPAHLIAVRRVFGTVSGASAEGKISATNLYEESPFGGDEFPWFSWPWWAFLANPISSATWDTSVPAGKSVTFEYDWSYYYRP
jgi:hypothetical protein